MNTTQAAAAYRAHQSGGPVQVVQRHLDLVKRTALWLSTRLPSNIQVDDLIQAGMLGLVEASRNHDPATGATFETFAGHRIRGAMLEEVRRSDWTPRRIVKQQREIVGAIRQIEQQTGAAASSQEVADVLGISLEDYYARRNEAARGPLLSLDEHAEANDGEVKSATVGKAVDWYSMREQLGEELVRAIKSLPEREQLVLSLHYEKELTPSEVAAVLGVSPSRVSQLHSQAVLRLRARLRDWELADAIDAS